MRFQLAVLDLDPGLDERNLLPHDHPIIHLAEFHADQVEESDLGARQRGLHPELKIADEDDRDNHRDNQQDAAQHPAPMNPGKRVTLSLCQQKSDIVVSHVDIPCKKKFDLAIVSVTWSRAAKFSREPLASATHARRLPRSPEAGG